MKATVVIAIVLAAGVAGLAQATAETRGGATVSTATSKLGTIVVDSRGRTLYLFEKDTRGRSTCAGACAGYWPPLLTRAAPTAGHGAKHALLGVIRRTDGTRQVTYAGHPLYRFVQDARRGQTNGQDLHDFGAGWYVLSPAGAKIERGGS
jgi:predicted lipoprotein with Yx(FWY)xxD motif